MAKQVDIDTEACIGCESCSEICPEVFGFDTDEEKAVVINADGGDIGCAEEAALACPVDCITVE